MANPAQLLLDQFNIWKTLPPPQPNRPAVKARQVRNPELDEFQAHRLAVQHLEAINQLLDEMGNTGADVHVYRRYFPEWCKAVFCYPGGWNSAPADDVPDRILEHLQTLAESLRYYVPVLTSDGLEATREYAEKIKQALAKDDSIPDPLRVHAYQVVDHLLNCVTEYSRTGDFLLAEAVERLAATVVRVASNSSEENRSKLWSPVMTSFVWPFAMSMVAAIPQQALTLLALGSGL